MRKRALSILLCAALVLSLAACGGGQTGNNSTEPPAGSTSGSQQTTGNNADDKQNTDSSKDKEPDNTTPEKTNPAESSTSETKEEFKAGDFTFTFEDGVLTISGQGALDQDALSVGLGGLSLYVEDVKQLVLEEGVTEIGEEAFKGWSMTSVTIPESVTKIGDEAFWQCSWLTSVTMPESVMEMEIERCAFGYCGLPDDLTNITIPEGTTAIGPGAFTCTP